MFFTRAVISFVENQAFLPERLIFSCRPWPWGAQLAHQLELEWLPNQGIPPIPQHAHNKHRHYPLRPESSPQLSQVHGSASMICTQGKEHQLPGIFSRQLRDIRFWKTSALKRSLEFRRFNAIIFSRNGIILLPKRDAFVVGLLVALLFEFTVSHFFWSCKFTATPAQDWFPASLVPYIQLLWHVRVWLLV